jgi:hypothetical protein
MILFGLLAPTFARADSTEFPTDFCKQLLEISATVALEAKALFEIAIPTPGIHLERNFFDEDEMRIALHALQTSSDPLAVEFVEKVKKVQSSHNPKDGLLSLRNAAERQFTHPESLEAVYSEIWADRFISREDFEEARDSWIFHELIEHKVLPALFIFNAHWKIYVARHQSQKKVNVSGLTKIIELFNHQIDTLGELWDKAVEHDDPFVRYVIGQVVKEISLDPNAEIVIDRSQCESDEQYEAFRRATEKLEITQWKYLALQKGASENPLAAGSDDSEDNGDWWKNGDEPPEFKP